MDDKSVLDLLSLLGIDCEVYDHPAVYTVEEAEKHRTGMKHATHSKNLFLKDSKQEQFYLLSSGAHEKFKIKEIRKMIGAKKLRLAPKEDLISILGLEPGSVSPLGLINDTDKVVRYLITKKIWQADPVAFHPNINTKTVIFDSQSFHKIIEHLGYEPKILDL